MVLPFSYITISFSCLSLPRPPQSFRIIKHCSPSPIGHTSPILCASFSPTGNLLATGSGDCNARLWDLFTETPSHVLAGHKGWVLCAEWEAIERKLATGGHDGHVSLLHFYQVDAISNLDPPSLVLDILVSVSSRRSPVYLGVPILPVNCPPPLIPQIRLWDPKTGKPIGEPLKGHSKWVTSLAWEPVHLYVSISFLPFFVVFFRSPLGPSCCILTLPIQFLRSRDLDLVTLPHQLIPLFIFTPLCSAGNRDLRCFSIRSNPKWGWLSDCSPRPHRSRFTNTSPPSFKNPISPVRS